MELKQYREARAVYLNYLSLALENEYVPSDVYIKAAKASEQYGLEQKDDLADRKSTRLNSSHGYISYAVFCLKKKKKKIKKVVKALKEDGEDSASHD